MYTLYTKYSTSYKILCCSHIHNIYRSLYSSLENSRNCSNSKRKIRIQIFCPSTIAMIDTDDRKKYTRAKQFHRGNDIEDSIFMIYAFIRNVYLHYLLFVRSLVFSIAIKRKNILHVTCWLLIFVVYI